MVFTTRSALSTTFAGELNRIRLMSAVNRRESAGVFQRVLHSVDHGSRAFANEVGILLLAMSNLLGQEVLDP
jgi:hypothetical protein